MDSAVYEQERALQNALQNYRNAQSYILASVEEAITSYADIGVCQGNLNVGQIFTSYHVTRLDDIKSICKYVKDEISTYGYDMELLYGKSDGWFQFSYLHLHWPKK